VKFDWNQEKNKKLIESRNISFERIVIAIEEGKTRDLLMHPNQSKFGNQQYILVEIEEYIWVVVLSYLTVIMSIRQRYCANQRCTPE